MPTAYYNEFDSSAAQWLRNLAAAGLITPGEIDARDIRSVTGAETLAHTRAHFFAGVAGWEEALRLADWPTDRPVWTGSCPCQPFSSAGKGLGEDDPRHLWPEFRRLIALWRPGTVIGEQVSSPAGRAWLARVRADLEALGYAVGAADLPAACLSAPHKRQRLFFVASRQLADPAIQGRIARGRAGEACGRDEGESGRLRDAGELDRTICQGRQGLRPDPAERGRGAEPRREPCRVDDADGVQRQGERRKGAGNGRAEDGVDQPSSAGGPGRFWDASDLICCRDEKYRRVESGTFPLVAGAKGRVVKLRAYGNSIIPQVAAEFIRAFLEAEADLM